MNLRKDARRIFQAALKAADPKQAVLQHLRLDGETLLAGKERYRLRDFQSIYVIGAGKASSSMAVAVEKLLGRRITGGLLNVKYGHAGKLRRIEQNECGHPVPDEAGRDGARRIMELAAKAGEHDLVICLISGGASALLPAPAPGITLEEKQQTTKLLLECGADIHEMNAVRKHISSIKGGQLAAAAHPAKVISLILSDVIGDDLDVIGSGPTAPDASTLGDAWAVVDKYGIADRLPAAVRERLRTGPETPKAGHPAFERTRNLIVGSNRQALEAAYGEARVLGYHSMILSSFLEGETRDVGRMHAAIAKEILASGRPVKRPSCVISGGETTVTIRGRGKGGRNQEFALAAALDIEGLRSTLVFSAGTDGTDGPTDAAGALCDGDSIARAGALGLDPKAALANNDSYPFFAALNDLVITGPTGTNVMDIHLILIR